MQFIVAFLLVCLLNVCQAQKTNTSPTCQQVSNQTYFNQCLQGILRVKGTMGSQLASDQVGACYTLLNNATGYQQCLCGKTSGILNCYELWCHPDPGEAIQNNYQLYFCKNFRLGIVLTAMPTLTDMPVAPSATPVDLSSVKPAVPRNYGNRTKSGSTNSLYSTSSLSVLWTTLFGFVIGIIAFIL